MKTTQTIIISLLISAAAFAQDTLVKMNGSELIGKVTVVESNQVTCEVNNGAIVNIRIIPNSDIFMIKFENGDRDLIYKEKKTEVIDYYNLGKADGKKYYKGNGAFVGGLVTGAGLPFGGYISCPIICAVKPTGLDNEKNPNNKLVHTNMSYKEGFQKGAHPKKVGKVLGGFALGVAALVGAFAYMLSTDF